MLDVCLLGTGGMMPLPRRWLTALMTRYNGHSLLIDCGEGTQVAIKEKGWSFKPGYSLEILRQGKFSPERAREQGIPLRYWNPLQKGQTIEADGVTYTPDMVLGPARKGLKVTYTTDTRPTESILKNASGSDLFICEGMYGEDDKLEKAKGYKHMTFREAATLAKQADVGEMWLTHYSPSLAHPEEYIEETRKIFSRTIAAKDGRSISLDFEQEEGTK